MSAPATTIPSFAVARAAGRSPVEAAVAATEIVTDRLPLPADLVVVFVTGAGATDTALTEAAAACRSGAVLGAAAPAGVLAEGVASAGTSAVAWAASLPGVRVRSFDLQVLPGGSGPVVVGLPPRAPDDRLLLLLGDPLSLPLGALAGQLAERRDPTVLAVLPAGPAGAGTTRLALDGRVQTRGAVGISLAGEHLAVLPFTVSGMRAVGPAMTVTDARDDEILALANAPAGSRLGAVVAALEADEQRLARGGVALGVAADEHGDVERYALTPLLSVGEQALRVGDRVEIGQTVRLHVPDPGELAVQLRRFVASGPASLPGSGTLIAVCGGADPRAGGLAADLAREVALHGTAPVAGCVADVALLGRAVHGLGAAGVVLSGR